jgi:hypothetical protein
MIRAGYVDLDPVSYPMPKTKDPDISDQDPSLFALLLIIFTDPDPSINKRTKKT